MYFILNIFGCDGYPNLVLSGEAKEKCCKRDSDQESKLTKRAIHSVKILRPLNSKHLLHL